MLHKVVLCSANLLTKHFSLQSHRYGCHPRSSCQWAWTMSRTASVGTREQMLGERAGNLIGGLIAWLLSRHLRLILGCILTTLRLMEATYTNSHQEIMSLYDRLISVDPYRRGCYQDQRKLPVVVCKVPVHYLPPFFPLRKQICCWASVERGSDGFSTVIETTSAQSLQHGKS